MFVATKSSEKRSKTYGSTTVASRGREELVGLLELVGLQAGDDKGL